MRADLLRPSLGTLAEPSKAAPCYEARLQGVEVREDDAGEVGVGRVPEPEAVLNGDTDYLGPTARILGLRSRSLDDDQPRFVPTCVSTGIKWSPNHQLQG